MCVVRLARVLQPLVGKPPHHIKNTKDFVHQISGDQLQQGECVSSYDVTALFTSVLTDTAIITIRRKLEQGQELHLGISITVKHISSPLEFCLKTLHFQFQGRLFEQLQGAALESPISPIVAYF